MHKVLRAYHFMYISVCIVLYGVLYFLSKERGHQGMKVFLFAYLTASCLKSGVKDE